MTSASFALLAVALMSAQDAGPRTLLPGVLDLPMIEGGRIDPTCGGERDEINPGDGLICLQPVSGDVETLQVNYARAALEAGWRLAFIEGATVFVERPGAAGRCDNLAFSQVTDGNGGPATALAVILVKGASCVQGAGQ